MKNSKGNIIITEAERRKLAFEKAMGKTDIHIEFKNEMERVCGLYLDAYLALEDGLPMNNGGTR